jgi:hypothetical protein
VVGAAVVVGVGELQLVKNGMETSTRINARLINRMANRGVFICNLLLVIRYFQVIKSGTMIIK